MRKLITLLCFIALSGSVNAQWWNTRQKAGGITQGFVTNSPGNSEALSKLVWQTADSSYYDLKFPVFKLSAYGSVRNDGTPTSIAWFDADGVVKRSPYPLIFDGNYNNLTNKPDLSVYTPTSRTINAKPLTSNIFLDKSDIGLSNVDNTSDINKPISTAQAAYSMFNSISKTANYTVVIGDWGVKPLLIVSVDATAGNVTITLPVPSAYQGRVINIKRMDASANTVTIAGNGSNIDSYASIQIPMQFGNAQIYSNNTLHLTL